jgi:ATP-dependent DNA helicase RecG
LKKLSTNNLSWKSSITALCSTPSKPTKTIQKLLSAHINTIEDLLWILPLRVTKLPDVLPFAEIKIGSFFKGSATVITVDISPVFGKRGKNKVQLYNATAVVKDNLSNTFLNLKWFNSYPNIKNQLEGLNNFTFLGIVSDYKGIPQIVNPSLNPKESENGILIEYPTVNGISGTHLKSVINKIPNELWKKPLDYFTKELSQELSIESLNHSFMHIHGKSNYDKDKYNKAKEDLIYFEFLKDQLKVVARKMSTKSISAPKIEVNYESIDEFIKTFPYQLTDDQSKVCSEIFNDFQQGHPMMRIVQGDVGCGKTTVAIVAALSVAISGGQVAIMCPTEALAQQHFKTFNELLSKDYTIDILVGSTKNSQRKLIQERLNNNETKILVGTHSLFQDSVTFSKLQLAIIDEQHKFGVEQRVRLVSKGEGTHCLLMSATPIPRTLQLAQYGDLDISTIKTIPSNRKGTQTRIIKTETYEKYLSFVKTRVELGEQIYIVVPAIEDNEENDLKNIEKIEQLYKNYFPSFSIQALHGKMNSDDKNSVLKDYNAGIINILISTSVIEVGINVLNATVMAIYNPERFGLSSLHQLRGRVGRGQKAGFCFLIPDSNISTEGIKRLKVVEKSHDGFEIAEADLKNRGEGDLFGSSQSGNISANKIANIFEHFAILEIVQRDVQKVKNTKPELFIPLLEELARDKKISTTV